MILQNQNFNHSSDKFSKALLVDDYTMMVCRERIFFAHFANSLHLDELFGDREDAPSEMTTVTGDLQRTLRMISDPLEYEVTLLWFIQFQRIASEAFKYYLAEKSNQLSLEEKLKINIAIVMSDLRAKENTSEDDVNYDLSIGKLLNKIKVVKQSNYNFHKYMELIGHPLNYNFSEVDTILKNVLKDNDQDK